MTQASVEVIVVDDDRPTAEEYARLILRYTGLGTVFTDDPDEAIQLVRANKVSVAVLDQRMPKMVGTALYRELVKYQPLLRAIMVTSEAEKHEVAEAWELGFKKFLDKENVIQTLPVAVLHEYNEYGSGLGSGQIGASLQRIYTQRLGLWRRPTIRYRLFSIDVIDEGFTFDSEWQEVVTLLPGQTEKTEIIRNFERTVTIEQESSYKLSAVFGLDAKQVMSINSRLQSELTERFKQSLVDRASLQTKIERSFQGPAEPEDINKTYVQVRRVEKAPAYKEVLVNLIADCGCCGRPSLLRIRAFVPTRGIALRQIDRLSDGRERISDLGISRT